MMTLMAVIAFFWYMVALGSKGDGTTTTTATTTRKNQYLYEDDSAVIEVKSSDPNSMFHSKDSMHRHRVVEFYSPYCGHCKNFRPKYIRVANEVMETHGQNSDDTPMAFYAVSCVAQREICQQHKIKAYPTVYVFPAQQTKGESVSTGSFSVTSIEKALHHHGTGPQQQQQQQPASRRLEVHEDNEDDNEEENDNGDEPGERDEDGEAEHENESGDHDNESEAGIAREEDEEVNDAQEQEEDAESEVDGDAESVGEDGVEEEPSESDRTKIGDEDNEENNDAEDKERDDDDEKDDDGEENESDEKEDIEFNSWKEFLSQETQKAGAEAAKKIQSDMDKWKEIQKQRIREKEYNWLRTGKAKPGSLGKDIVLEGGATKMMKAYRKGTKEFNDRQIELLNVLERMNYKKYGSLLDNMNKGYLPYKKIVPKSRIAENLPVIKRIARLRPEEQLILDATLSFREGLLKGVFLASKQNQPFSLTQTLAFQRWLELLRIGLPPEWAIHDLINELYNSIETISKNPSTINLAFAKHPFPRRKWSKSCGRKGLNCGFWKLLHIVSVGVAENRGGKDLIDNKLVDSDTKIFSPLEAADTIRDYMSNFFTCYDCAEQFVEQYNDCKRNRRCSRLTSNAWTATDDDWKELGKWLWEVHNDVNIRLLNQKYDEKRKRKQKSIFRKADAGPGAASIQDEVKALWPTVHSCLACFNSDGTFNEDAVFLHLEINYW
jgi:thiol-disulfide isomerase/thioredoxin